MAMRFRVVFQQGLHEPVEVEAETEVEAKKEGVAAYRKDCTMLDFKAVEQVVREVVPVLA